MPKHIGNETNYWTVSAETVDVSRGDLTRIAMHTETAELIFSPRHAALIVVDMQNYFCAPELTHSDSGRKTVDAIQNAVNTARRIQMPVGWVNWGNRPDKANLPPSVLYAFLKNSAWGGIGGILPDDLGPALIQTSWSTQLVEGLKPADGDWWVDKYRLSGFSGTVLDQILRNHNVTTLFFAGVNVDQCVWSTILDASFLGYDTVLLRDCAATTSPLFAEQATHYNLSRMGGFLSDSTDFEQGQAV